MYIDSQNLKTNNKKKINLCFSQIVFLNEMSWRWHAHLGVEDESFRGSAWSQRDPDGGLSSVSHHADTFGLGSHCPWCKGRQDGLQTLHFMILYLVTNLRIHVSWNPEKENKITLSAGVGKVSIFQSVPPRLPEALHFMHRERRTCW